MIERPRTHPKEEANEAGALYLTNLGVEWKDLRGKKVLDIGAMDAQFENVARRRGVDVVSMDMVVSKYYPPPADSRFVVGKATVLPFKEGSFDYAIAHMSAMNYDETAGDPAQIPEYKQGYTEEEYLRYLANVLRESCAVLKPGGEFRFTNTLLDEHELQRPDDVVPEKKTRAYERWIMQREHELLQTLAQDAGFRELRLVEYPESHPYKKDYYGLTHYFVAVK